MLNSFYRRAFGAMCVSLALISSASAQIRIVTYNTKTAFNTNGNINPGTQEVLQAIGNESVNGIARPIDILSLQEQNNATGTTTAQILNVMNGLYGANRYAKGNLIADNSIEPDTDSSAIIYDQTRFTLVAEKLVGTASGSGQPRQEIRYQFRPVGYSAAADFYVYSVHYKASDTAADKSRRNIEAQVMRADANTLPTGSRVLYTGDFNLTDFTAEAAWGTITGPGPNQGIDPMSGSFANGNKTYSTTNLASRYDYQFQTAPTSDGEGFSLINGSYRVFSNNGSIGNGGQSPNSFVRSASDHYPVVADYRYPARMSATVTVPAQAIIGASVPINVAVENTAPVLVAGGADGLDYTINSGGAISGSANVNNLAALAPANNHTLALNAATFGNVGGSINVVSPSQEVANGQYTQNVTVQVLDHSHPSFNNASEQTSATIDFGIKGRTLGGATSGFTVFNLALNTALTAGLDLDSITGVGDTGPLVVGGSTFTNLAAGARGQSFFASIIADANGFFTATYTLNFSDADLPGATARGPLTLTLKGIVATPGDSDLNGRINFDDYANIDNGFNQHLSGWENGDFDGNGFINFDDYALIDAFFNGQGSSIARAVSYLNGEDRSPIGMDSAALQAVARHFDAFGQPYAIGFIASVPEPGAMAIVIVGAIAVLRPSNKRQPPRRRETPRKTPRR